MMNWLNKKTCAALVVLCGLSGVAVSNNSAPDGLMDRDTARPVADDTRLAVFNYDPDLTYEIISRDSLFTHIELPPGEKVAGFYLSDTTRWKHHIAGNQERIFIKPTLAGLFNSGTLVTNRRVYELTFRSVKTTDPWYQRVRWSGDEETGITENTPRLAAAGWGGGSAGDMSAGWGGVSPAGGATGIAPASTEVRRNEGDRAMRNLSVSPASLNFAYDITGDAPFRPVMVFDDGKFTWIQVGSRPELPALFLIRNDGRAEVVNYTIHGDYMMISQTIDGVLMKLGKDEIKITRKPKCAGFLGC